MKKEMVLIADDQLINRNLLKGILDNSYFVVETSNVKQTINFLKQNKDVLSFIIVSDTLNFEEVIKENKNLDKEIPFCISMVPNNSKALEIAKLYGINNFINKPYNKDIVLKLLDTMFTGVKKDSFIANDFATEYDAMIQKNLKFEDEAIGSCRIDFEKQSLINEYGIIKDLVNKESLNTFSSIIESLASHIIEGDKDLFLEKFSYKNIKENFKKHNYSLEQTLLFKFDNEIKNIKIRAINISNMTNGTNTALLVLSDKIEDYIVKHLQKNLFENEYEIVSLINLNTGVAKLYNYDDSYGFNSNLIEYDELAQTCLNHFINKNDLKTFESKVELENIIESLKNDSRYDLTSYVSNQSMKFYQLSYKYLDEYHQYVVFYVEDITKRRESDFITDGLNYQGFLNKSYEITKDSKKKYALVYCNCVNYKDIIEYVSVDTIVNFLKSLYDLLNHSFLKPLIIGRNSSDNFWLLIENDKIDLSKLESFNSIELKDGDNVFFLNFRFGIYLIDKINHNFRIYDLDSYCERAKIAEASLNRESQTNYVVFNDTLRDDFIIKSTIVNDIKSAIENDEIDIALQPIYDINGNKIVSAEALVRWKHHSYGYIAPGLFIPFIEANGTISKIDKYVIEKTKSFLKELKEENLLVPISVNLSRLDFFDKELVDLIIQNCLTNNEENGILNYEVTESYYIDLTNNMANVLNDLRMHNSKILLDDFGDGLSSFKALISSQFDIIKIYKGLVDQIETSKTASESIKSIISMCHSVGLEVVAEGVENEKQLRLLKSYKADYIQGYIYGKPMSREEFKQLLKYNNI